MVGVDHYAARTEIKLSVYIQIVNRLSQLLIPLSRIAYFVFWSPSIAILAGKNDHVSILRFSPKHCRHHVVRKFNSITSTIVIFNKSDVYIKKQYTAVP